MDLLSQALAATHLKSSLLGKVDISGAWTIDFEETSGSPTHYVRAGQVWFWCPPDPPELLQAGDLVMIPRWNRYYLSTALDAQPTTIREIVRDLDVVMWQPGELLDAPVHLKLDGEDHRCGLLSMIFQLDNAERTPLIQGLPRRVLIRKANEVLGGLLEPTLNFLGEEAAAARPGYAVASNRLAELLFIQIIRCLLKTMPDEMSGMLRGLAEPGVGRALAAMHTRPDNRWTISRLAIEAGLSRSVLAARFRQLIGMTINEYLTELRVSRAIELLEAGATWKTAAACVGYSGPGPLAKAFGRTRQSPPQRIKKIPWARAGAG